MAPDWRIALALFLVIVCLVHWEIGNRFQLSLDEGIYLEGAARVSQGQAPYRDFFNITGPGTFWLFGAIFGVFDATLSAAHFVLSLEIAIIAMTIFWYLWSLTSQAFAAGASLVFVTYCLDSPRSLYISHRWDSNTCALAALVLLQTGLTSMRSWVIFVAGVFAASAAWITPPFLIVSVLMGACIRWAGSWRQLIYYVGGMAVPSIAAASVLMYQGALGPMLQQLLWAVYNYGPSNRVPYGYIEAAPVGWVQLILESLPAMLPIAAYLGFIVLLFRRREILKKDKTSAGLLVAFSVGGLGAAFPRLGAHQLLFISPVFLILSGYVLFACLANTARRALSMLFYATACLLFIISARQNSYFREQVLTIAGQVRCTAPDARLLRALREMIIPGDTLFVFPYLPILSFITGGQNPTSYTFLQPGMMTQQDEETVLAQLTAHPPRWMLWAAFPSDFWLSNWPRTNPARLQWPAVERFMEERYRQVLGVQLRENQKLFLACDKNNCPVMVPRISP